MTQRARRSGESGGGSACGLRDLGASGAFAPRLGFSILRYGAEGSGAKDALDSELEAGLLHSRPDEFTLVRRHADFVFVEARHEVVRGVAAFQVVPDGLGVADEA